MTFYSQVGSFTAPASTGSQATTGVGFTPVALFLWTSAQTASGWTSTYVENGFGFATANGSGSIFKANATTTYLNGINAVPLYVKTYSGTVALNASYVSFDSDGFTLNFATTTYGDRINYLAIGGTDVVGAMVKTWQTRTTAGSQSVTGIGFQPDLVINLSLTGTVAPPTTLTTYADIGAMDGNGNQFARSGYAASYKWQVSDACIMSGSTSETLRAAYTSMDADGFTVNFSTATAAEYIVSLCLKGGQYQVGKWSKSTSAASDTIAISNVTIPLSVLVVSNNIATSATYTSYDRLMIGASDGTNNCVSAFTCNGTTGNRYWNSENSIYITNNDTESMQTAGTIGSFGSGQFVASYSTHDSVATEICFVAFGGGTISYEADLSVISIESQPIVPPFTIDHTNTPTVISPEAAPTVPLFTIDCLYTPTVTAAECAPINPTAPISVQTITTIVIPAEAAPIDVTPTIVFQITTTVISPEASPVNPTAPISIQTITTVIVPTEAAPVDPTAPISVQAITLSVIATEANVVNPTAPISVQLLTMSVIGTEAAPINLIPKIDAALTTTVVAAEVRETDPSFTIDCSLTLTVNETEINAVDVSDIVIWSGTFVTDFNIDERTDLKVYGNALKANGDPYPLDDVTIEWNMRDKNGTILVTKSTADGSIMIEDSASGMFSFNLTATETDFSLEPTYERPVVCRHEARITDGADEYVGTRGRAFVMPSQTGE